DLPMRALFHPIPLHRAEGLGQAFVDVGIRVPADNLAFSRRQVDQTLKSGLDRIQVFEDIGVIKFDRGQDDGLGEVMQELWAFVEECRVVFIALQDEMLTLAQREAAAEVLGNAAYKKRRIAAGGLEDPRQHGGRCGLAVGSGNYDRLPRAKKKIVESVRQGPELNSFVENVLQLDVAAGD